MDSPREQRLAARRLYDRMGFGARPGELDNAVLRGFDATASSVLARDRTDAGVASTPLPDLGPDPLAGLALDDPARVEAGARSAEQVNAAILWWLDRMVAADCAFTERLTWFWHGHFATSVQAVRSATMMLGQNEAMRQLGAGDFLELAQALTIDPATVIWLNGQENRAGSPNENLARELMELFVLGVDEYTEADVQEAARALTGWRVDRATARSYLDTAQQDTGAKTVLGVTGPLDAASLVALLADRAVSPAFLARRMWSRFVSHEPAPDTAVARLVTAYGPQRDIGSMVHAVVREPAFVDPASGLVKQPVEWLVGLMRALGLRPSAMSAKAQKGLLSGLLAIGQRPLWPPNVGGWPAGVAWLTTATAMARVQLCQIVLTEADTNGIKRMAPAVRADAVGELLGVDAWGGRTTGALARAQDNPRNLLLVAACAPEYVVSG